MVVIGVVTVGVVVLSWVILVVLARRLPPGLARELAAFLPNCVTMLRRLRSGDRLPWRAKAALAVAAVWVASPVDLVPEFLPVVGALDDVVVVALALRYAVRSLPRQAVLDAWPGEPRTIERLLSSAGRVPPGTPGSPA